MLVMKNSPPIIGLRSPHPKEASGFTLVEVLISILMIAGFLATAMQALISATAIKVRSEEISEATTWIQEDLEAIRFEANRLGLVDGTHDPTSLNVNDCTPGASDAGFADDLETVLTNNSADYSQNTQAKFSAVGDRPYTLQRTLNASFNTLEIEYEVINPRTGDAIGELYSEVVPDVSLACP